MFNKFSSALSSNTTPEATLALAITSPTFGAVLVSSSYVVSSSTTTLSTTESLSTAA